LDRAHLEGKRWGPGGRRSMARSGSNRGLLRPDFAGWETSQQQTRGCDAIAHLKFTGVDAAVAIPHSPAFDSARNRSGRPQPFPGRRQPKRERRSPGALREIGLHGRKQPSVMAKCYFTLWPRLTRQRGSKSHGKNSLREFKWHVLHGVCRELKFR
jgi:hypothetical protein